MACGCGCGGVPSSVRMAALRGDDHALRLAASPQETIGGLLPTFVTPGVVRALKARLAPQFATTDADVRACSAVAGPELAAWDAFNASWRAYLASEETFWGVKSEYDAGLLFESSLERWQTQLEGRCKLAAPKIQTQDSLTDLSPVKWAAVAVIAVAVVYGVHTVLK